MKQNIYIIAEIILFYCTWNQRLMYDNHWCVVTYLQTPPFQKFAVELNTISSSIKQRWEFKISYTTFHMTAPRDLTNGL